MIGRRSLLACVLAIGACGAREPAPTIEPPSRPGPPGVALRVTPDAATVVVDERELGPAASLAPVIELAPGLHTLVVTHDGYQPYRAEFTVTDRTEQFAVRLEPLP